MEDSLAFRRRAMAVRGFLCQNIANGCAIGGFSVALVPLREHFQVGTGTASLAISVAMLVSGLMSPLTGAIIVRSGLRATMMVGALFTILGYVALAFAPSIYWFLAAYGLLVGVGVAMCGSFPSNVLVSTWFQPHPGRAVGFINMAVMMALVPLFMGPVVERFGLRVFYLTFAGISVMLIPIIWGVADRRRGPRQDSAGVGAGSGMMRTAELMRSPSFWTLVIGAGALTAISIVTLSHIIAVVLEGGRSSGEATLLASVRGGATIVGSLACGFLCERIGAARTLALVGACFGASWAILVTATHMVPLILATFVLGCCAGGTYGAVNVLASKLFGAATLPRTLGLWSALILPLTFLLPPGVGVLHDAANGYGPAALLIILICAVVATGFYTLGRVLHRRTALHSVEPVCAS